MPGRSTNQALLYFTDKVLSAFEDNKYVCGLFLDLSKAFDTLDHHILLQKLASYGIRGTPLNWFSSYLSNRVQCVSMAGKCSNFLPLSTGVPQGSILGSLFFVIYVNDLSRCTPNFEFTLYADDTSIICNNNDVRNVIDTVNSDMPKVVAWFKANKLHLNSKKSVAILFRPRQRHLDNSNLNILIDGSPITFSSQTKFLGVVIDEHLSWGPHIDFITNKVAKGAGVIRKLKYKLPLRILITLYYILILPYMMYSCIVWGNSSKSKLQNLYITRKKIVRFVTNSARNTHTNPLFKQTKILPFFDQIYFHNAVFMYQFQNSLLPSPFIDFFKAIPLFTTTIPVMQPILGPLCYILP